MMKFNVAVLGDDFSCDNHKKKAQEQTDATGNAHHTLGSGLLFKVISL
jgi:hypothetical protein